MSGRPFYSMTLWTVVPWTVVAWTVAIWLLLAAVAPDARAAVYRHMDAQGNTVWSDRPGGTRAQVRAPRVLSPATAIAPATAAPATASVPAVFIPYQRVILKPRTVAVTLEQARRGVALRVDTVPSLRAGDRVQLLIDGRRHQSPLSSRLLVAMGLASGRHDLMAEVLDSAGNVRQRSSIVTLEVLAAADPETISP